MARGALARWLAHGGGRLHWIEFDAYAHHVFARAADDWWSNPARHAAALQQAQGIVGSDILTVDVSAPFISVAPGTTCSAVAAALAASAPRGFLASVLDALLHHYGARLDIVLKVQAARDLFDPGADFDALDNVVAAQTELLRHLSQRAVSGILLARASADELDDDEIDAYQPLFGAARHYGWATAMSFHGRLRSVPGPFELDLALWPDLPFAELPPAGDKPRSGGGLNAGFWRAAPAPVAVPDTGLLYGVIPRDAVPEAVANIARSWRS